jgi:ribosomal protein L37AE/L43A
MEHARHVFRVALVLAFVVGAVLVARGFLVPRSYGLYGAYRGDNVREQMNVRRPLHGGAAACGECHPEQLARRGAGSHRAVSCEVCHGPLGLHVKADGSVTPPSFDRSFELCARCHRRIAGRPAAFPQVVLEEHVAAALDGKVCLGCHDPHSPKP